MRKIIKLILLCVKSIILFIIIGAVSTAVVKNTQKIILVEQFKNKGVYQEDISTETVKFYKIESTETLPAFIKKGNTVYPGSPGDILVSTQATLVNPFISGFISFFAGGHAAICMDDYGDFQFHTTELDSIEATGLGDGENLSSIFNRSYWAKDDPFTEVIGLRVSMTESERKEILSLSASLLDDPYNYSFLFNTVHTSYCSDLISKVYRYIGVNLNKDDFTTSIYDLIISGDSYISYYHYFDSAGIKHIYYLG